MRGRGDAFYKSSYEPRAQELAGQSQDFDPLAQFLAEGHAAGIQIHAWINANLTWGSMTPPVSPEHIVNKHPDWLMRTNENKFTMLFGRDVEGAYTCPSNQIWRKMYVDIYLDVVNNYDVDGVHFDFIRYPSPRFCYCDRCLTEFAERMKEAGRTVARGFSDRLAYPKAYPAQWDDYRREQITAMVYSVYDAVKQARPQVIVSASVFPDVADARNARYQDWTRWAKDGKIDLICPMSYSPSTAKVARQVKEAVENSSGSTCVRESRSIIHQLGLVRAEDPQEPATWRRRLQSVCLHRAEWRAQGELLRAGERESVSDGGVPAAGELSVGATLRGRRWLHGDRPLRQYWRQMMAKISVDPIKAGLDPKGMERAEAILNDGVARKLYPGGSAWVWRHGATALVCSAGTTDYSGKSKVDEDTLFDMASVHKGHVVRAIGADDGAGWAARYRHQAAYELFP